MKATIRRRYGSPNQIKIENVEKPVSKDNEVLIKVYATTVNRTDCANLTAKPFIMRLVLGLFKPRKIILGTDFAGKVVSIGKNVKSFRIGDKVFGFNDTGSESHAEFITTTVENLFPIPEKIDYKQAAASLEGANYAYTFIHKVNIQSGQKILINGATGGIGSALLQFVRQYDVEITATCNTKNMKLIQSLGADKIYDYTKDDFTNDNDKYDFIFDAVGKSTFGKCKSLLRKKGVYISSELGPYYQNIFYPILTSISSKKVFFPIPYSKQKTIPYICNLLEKEKFKPVIDREYLLEDISKAYEYVITGQKTGNVLINVWKNESTTKAKTTIAPIQSLQRLAKPFDILRNMQKKFNWQAYSNDDRNKVIEEIKNAISAGDGYIMNFNMFSDLGLTLSIEIEEYKIESLHKALSLVLNVSELEHQRINQESKKDWLIFLNISFGRGKGELKQEIPEVPG